jgi:predicted deacylase
MSRAPLLPLLALLTVGCSNAASLMPTSPTPVPTASRPAVTGYTVEGMVTTTSETGSRPIAGVRIAVVTPAGLFDATTDDQGRYRMTVMPSEVCEITVTKEGFVTVHARTQLSGHTIMNFELRGL